MLKFVTLASIVAGAFAATCPVADVSAVAHTGTPVGTIETHDGLSMYISKPKNCKVNATVNGVLYLTDVFGIQLNENKLLVDSFARAGYHVVAPDLFDGSPAPGDINVPGFNTTAFLAAHGPNVTDPKIAKAVAYMRGELGIKRIGVTGYCFGGRYSFRSVAAGAGTTGGDVAFAAHPSLLTDDEISGVRGPASVAAAETDNMLTPARRAQVETLLKASNQTWSMAIYSGTSHGFAVRGNVADPKIKFGKESAFFQAVRWFDAWL